jgi:hypothetical protein
VGGGECRFIRLVQIGRSNYGDDTLCISAWEIFGSLIASAGFSNVAFGPRGAAGGPRQRDEALVGHRRMFENGCSSAHRNGHWPYHWENQDIVKDLSSALLISVS